MSRNLHTAISKYLKHLHKRKEMDSMLHNFLCHYHSDWSDLTFKGSKTLQEKQELQIVFQGHFEIKIVFPFKNVLV